MLEIVRSTQFKKDLKKIIKQGKDLDLLEEVVNKLQKSETLPPKNCDHLLSGDWRGFRECHISPDWLLIYKNENELKLLRLVRTGSHSELFR
ncbi:TPA: type II toxin-antitoxin system mRNA interferase toxin, RelE/StbE family [Legionella pneumophila subsp. pneumophila]|uniref:type II toxin-antitoxin system YafQ family toxin n=1 Tax=Legionella pneumophila TaxID=446 RepID=UPI0007707653|nr:type II toxin-antitoxin system YafQ family toxin [Legionella pneumophila]HAT9216372.1 type II toxin-antitoxin system mRNA interferase toxin, RelE/StbE family [Legionella pneumophila subsp. pneumophila]CZI17302.1 mRNA interferase YafQ [Legionella pneumophila]HAT9262453.1 type II toxin-antitoxin system mRNA interferase toxin, RelE/StbE family [Legionella pneumophila subsp. pneumophila]HAT9283869.1 type II toxin-antitoxin system mRNA interferase toxin, RelE/StbE family [Legionella pneumophila s